MTGRRAIVNGNANGITLEQNGKRKRDEVANGFYGNKNNEKSTRTGFENIGSFLHHTFLPTTIVAIMPSLTVLLWYTMAACGGSYTRMLSLFSDWNFTSGLANIWLTYLSRGIFFPLLVLFGYFVWAVFWMKILPGEIVKGPMTPNKNIPVYIDNGFLHYKITMLGFLVLTGILKFYGKTPTVVIDQYGEFVVSLNIIGLLFSLGLYFKGIHFPSSSDSGKSGNFIFDYYWGTELYPRVFGIDLKVLTNCRFGMTVWAIIVSLCMLKSYEMWGFVDSIFVSTILQLVYITKFFTWEGGYMSTIDISVDRAGFYICWGCLAYLPTLYPAVSLYLVTHPVQLGHFWSTVIFLLGLASIGINYQADLQRQDVRAADGKCLVWGKKPDVIRAKYILENGDVKESILLASGWWGQSRHFHYVPELLLSFFWTVPALSENLLPYTYLIFLLILLTHRSFRDERKCSKKYGPYWQEYCRKVPYKIVPWLF